MRQYATDGMLIRSKDGGFMGIFSAVEILNDNENKIKELERKLEIAVEALKYTQRTDVRIGHSDETEDNVLRGMPDKIMMRNRCRDALEKLSHDGEA